MLDVDGVDQQQFQKKMVSSQQAQRKSDSVGIETLPRLSIFPVSFVSMLSMT